MGSSRSNGAERAAKPARRIISRFISEEQRLTRTTSPGHLDLLGKELGVKSILTRPMASAQEQHPGIDAMLVPLPEGYSVVINERAAETRRAYSLAHELAHIMLLELESSAEASPKRSGIVQRMKNGKLRSVFATLLPPSFLCPKGFSWKEFIGLGGLCSTCPDLRRYLERP